MLSTTTSTSLILLIRPTLPHPWVVHTKQHLIYAPQLPSNFIPNIHVDTESLLETQHIANSVVNHDPIYTQVREPQSVLEHGSCEKWSVRIWQLLQDTAARIFWMFGQVSIQ